MAQLEIRRSHAAVHQSQARLRFLDQLAEATQPLVEADAVMATRARLLCHSAATRSAIVAIAGLAACSLNVPDDAVRFGPEQLRDKALLAIDEAAEQSLAVPLPRTKALAFALAYLWAVSGGERWPFDNFWQAVAANNQTGRSQSVNAARNAIYRTLGLELPAPPRVRLP